MGFYNPATLVKDAQRHGLKCKPIDLMRSDWNCTLEKISGGFALRLGLRYAKGLREAIALEIVRQRELRKFISIDDLKQRVPEIQKAELTTLAEIGALNFASSRRPIHRRDALWQVERAARPAGPLLESEETFCESSNSELHDAPAAQNEWPAFQDSPLLPMTAEERLAADFRGTGITVGPHPMAYRRAEMQKQGVRRAIELAKLPDGTHVRVAGAVIARQRPGTAHGFVFLSLEDETGIANAIITPQLFEMDQTVVVHHSFLLIEGTLQNQDNVVSVKAQRVQPLSIMNAETVSHDFH
jgi:error-prone DNA polymerase